MFFYILLAIVLIGVLTVALRDNNGTNSDIDKESAGLKADQILAYSTELSQAVQTLLNNGTSETAIRFSTPGSTATYGDITLTPTAQVFSKQGGNAVYRAPPKNSTTNIASKWAFYAEASPPMIGSPKADLIATLLYLNDGTCRAINKRLGLSEQLPSSTCPGSFSTWNGTYNTSVDAINWTPAPTMPVPQACVTCTVSGVTFNKFYTVLIAR